MQALSKILKKKKKGSRQRTIDQFLNIQPNDNVNLEPEEAGEKATQKDIALSRSNFLHLDVPPHPLANYRQNPIVDAGPAGGGASAEENIGRSGGRINISYTGSGFDTLTAMPSHYSSLPLKRPPSIFMGNFGGGGGGGGGNGPEDIEVPEEMGQIPGSETAVNGAFKNQPISHPQKSIFMTYESETEDYFDCKIPIKINIPGGDFGLYKITVNEVLFRNDAPILTGKDWIEFTFNNPVMTLKIEDSQNINNILGSTTMKKLSTGDPIPNKITYRFELPAEYKDLNIYYLNMKLLREIIKVSMANDKIPTLASLGWAFTKDNIDIPGLEFKDTDTFYVAAKISDLFEVVENSVSQNGIIFRDNLAKMHTREDHEGTTINGRECIVVTNFSYSTFSITCSQNFRNMFPPLSTVTTVTSKKTLNITKILEGANYYQAINIPILNFAGPPVFMLNTTAQTSCPIANEYFQQFNTCALSYNTDIIPQQLVQMNSNIPLILKEGTDFRISLTDIFGNPIRLQSPIYVQVTVSAYSNEAMSQLIQNM